MSVYIIAQLKFTRRELYDRYQSRFMGVFSKFKGSCWSRMRIQSCWKANGRATRS
jgi:uncharacterized protein (DUF1330 family)